MNGQSNLTAGKFWQLHGDQPGGWGNQDHNDYSGTAYKRYTIKIGEKFAGQISHIVFVADFDNQHTSQNIVFKPVTFREDGVDASDDVPFQRAFDDDEKGRGLLRPGPGTQLHNFHDQGDVDWSIAYGAEFRVRTNLIGSNADTKLTVYRWESAEEDEDLGYFVNVVDVEIGSDDSLGASEFVMYGTQDHTLCI